MILFLKALAKYTELERRKKSSYSDVGVRTKRITIIKAAEYFTRWRWEKRMKLMKVRVSWSMGGGNKAKNPSK